MTLFFQIFLATVSPHSKYRNIQYVFKRLVHIFALNEDIKGCKAQCARVFSEIFTTKLNFVKQKRKQKNIEDLFEQLMVHFLRYFSTVKIFNTTK